MGLVMKKLRPFGERGRRHVDWNFPILVKTLSSFALEFMEESADINVFYV